MQWQFDAGGVAIAVDGRRNWRDAVGLFHTVRRTRAIRRQQLTGDLTALAQPGDPY